jgi:hypothetical protein
MLMAPILVSSEKAEQMSKTEKQASWAPNIHEMAFLIGWGLLNSCRIPPIGLNLWPLDGVNTSLVKKKWDIVEGGSLIGMSSIDGTVKRGTNVFDFLRRSF